ncbi:MAG: hypothetical protein C4536_14195 [Actinobacteria bacterium]|nr:MAG: hypothetical protein C4536_14195 [Actinomycetota bacterium]
METIEEAIKKCERNPGRYKSFFVKRLEQHLAEKGITIPGRIFSLFDTPFDNFTPEYVSMYEQKIKGQALFHIFSDMLVEIYQRLDADKIGWESAANFLQDTPMKVCALQALKRIDQLEAMPENDYLYMVEQFSGLAASAITPKDQKFGVRPYSGNGKNRWWKKEEPRLVASGVS